MSNVSRVLDSLCPVPRAVAVAAVAGWALAAYAVLGSVLGWPT